MEKRILVVLTLLLITGSAFAQSPGDSLRLLKKPQVQTSPFFKKEANKIAWGDLLKNKAALSNQFYTNALKSKEQVTPFYSTMPVAKMRRKESDLPVAKADSTVQYHLLQKRIKVLPIPIEEVTGFGQETQD